VLCRHYGNGNDDDNNSNNNLSTTAATNAPPPSSGVKGLEKRSDEICFLRNPRAALQAPDV
jgi:hypothetical protein